MDSAIPQGDDTYREFPRQAGTGEPAVPAPSTTGLGICGETCEDDWHAQFAEQVVKNVARSQKTCGDIWIFCTAMQSSTWDLSIWKN